MMTVEVVVRAEDFDPYKGLNTDGLHRQSIGNPLVLSCCFWIGNDLHPTVDQHIQNLKMGVGLS